MQTLPVDTTLPVAQLATALRGQLSSFEMASVNEKEKDTIDQMIQHCKATDAWYRAGANKGDFGNSLALSK